MTNIGEGYQLVAILELTITKVTLLLLLAKKEKHVMINNDTPNKSLDVRAKQRLSSKVTLFP